MGGPARERVFDVDSRVSFSPDGRRICFRRFDTRAAETRVIVRDLDSGQERVLATVRQPTTMPGPPVWSPDGRHIVVFEQSLPIYASVVAEYDVASGGRRQVFRRTGTYFYDLAWLPGGRELAIVGDEPHLAVSNQVYVVSVADGAVRSVTNDTNDYASLTSAAAETALAVVRSSAIANVWLADAATGEARRVTSATTTEASPWEVAPGDDGSIVYTSMQDQAVGLWYLPAAGGVPRRVSTGPGWAVTPYLVGGQVVYFGLDLKGGGHVYRVAPDGGDPQRLTNGHGEQVIAASPHGGYFIYALADSANGLWSMPASGGAPRLLSGSAEPGWASPSPDGMRIAVREHESGPDGRTRSIVRVLPAAGGAPVASLRMPENSESSRFQLGSDGLFYTDLADPGHNLVELPLDGRAPVRVTSFHEGIVSTFQLSPDGSRIAVRRRIGGRTSAWIVDARSGRAIEVRGVDAPDMFRIVWSPDGRHIAMNAGTESDDAVILRGGR
jgi:Tol biopolymer transport system component